MDLAVNIIISSVGFAYFVYGKKTTEFSFLVAGLLLMIYPYFVQSFVFMVLIGVILVIAPFVLRAGL